jgi:hypothetical protein
MIRAQPVSGSCLSAITASVSWGTKQVYASEMKVSVYVNKDDEAKLKAAGKDPAEWVRGLVKHALKRIA